MALRTLSRAAFMALPAAKRGKGDYQDYIKYVTNTRQRRQQARLASRYPGGVVPTAPGTSVNIGAPPPSYQYQPFVPKSHAGDVFPGFQPIPQATLRSQAQQFISQSIDPVLANIRSTYAGREKSGAGQITGYVNALAQSLGQLTPAYTQIADTQIGQSQQANQGLQDFIKSQAAALGQGAAAADPNAAAALQSQAGALGASQGLQTAGQNSADVQQAIADKGANLTYAELQPAIARQQGVQQLGEFERGITQAQADALSQVTNQVPGMTQQIYQNLLDRELSKAQTRQQLISDAYTRDYNRYQTNQQGKQTAATSALQRYQQAYSQASDNANRALAQYAAQIQLGQIDPNVSAGLGYPASSLGLGDPSTTFTAPGTGTRARGTAASQWKNLPATQQATFRNKVIGDVTKTYKALRERTVSGGLFGKSTPNAYPVGDAVPGVVQDIQAQMPPGTPASVILGMARVALANAGYSPKNFTPLLNAIFAPAPKAGAGTAPARTTAATTPSPTAPLPPIMTGAYGAAIAAGNPGLAAPTIPPNPLAPVRTTPTPKTVPNPLAANPFGTNPITGAPYGSTNPLTAPTTVNLPTQTRLAGAAGALATKYANSLPRTSSPDDQKTAAQIYVMIIHDLPHVDKAMAFQIAMQASKRRPKVKTKTH